MSIDGEIEELRAELKACMSARESRLIKRELESALARRGALETAGILRRVTQG